MVNLIVNQGEMMKQGRIFTNAMTTKIVKVRSERIFADRPMFCGTAISHIFTVSLSDAQSAYENDQFYETFAAHETSNGKGLPPLKPVQSRSQSTANNLTSESHSDDTNHISPSDAIIQESQVGAQA